MKMKKSMIIALLILIIILVSRYMPIKYAVHNLEIEKKEYILVKSQKVTGFDWHAIADNLGYFEKPLDIVLQGDVPDFEVPHPISYEDNTFVCYGNYENEIVIAGQLCRVFQVEHWSILYPIKRSGMLPNWLYPNYGLTIWD